MEAMLPFRAHINEDHGTTVTYEAKKEEQFESYNQRSREGRVTFETI